MKFGINNIEQFKKDWGHYNDSLYRQCLGELIRMMSFFEPRLQELCLTDIRNNRLNDEQTIIGVVKYHSQSLIRESIVYNREVNKNQTKGVSNRFYLDNYTLLNSICNKVLFNLLPSDD